MIQTTWVTGDLCRRPCHLTKNGASFPIGTGESVRAVLVHQATGATSVVIDLDHLASGSDWNNSLVIVEFTGVQSKDFAWGESQLQIKVDTQPLTWRFDGILVVPGKIS